MDKLSSGGILLKHCLNRFKMISHEKASGAVRAVLAKTAYRVGGFSQ